MQLELSADADADIDEAAAWYFEQELELGVRFAVEVRRVLDQIVEHPLAWTQIEPGIRRAVLHRFPYSVFYGIDAERIEVFAVLHHCRDPASWRERR